MAVTMIMEFSIILIKIEIIPYLQKMMENYGP